MIPVKVRDKESAQPLVVVGEAPGEREVQYKRPFIGSAGYELKKQFLSNGMELDNYHLTNVCKYRPPGNNYEFWGDSHPLVTEGIRELQSLIDRSYNRVFLLVGATATRIVLGLSSVSTWRGSVFKIGSNIFIPTYHPSYIFRMWKHRQFAIADIAKAKRYIKGHQSVYRTESKVLYKFHEIEEALQSLAGDVAWDIETDRGNRILCIGFCSDYSTAYSIPIINPVLNKHFHTIDREAMILNLIQKTMDRTNTIGHNYLFDSMHLLQHWKIFSPLWGDTMYTHYIMYPEMEKSLGLLSSLYLDDHMYWKHENKPGTLWKYNCKDVAVTLRLWTLLRSSAKMDGEKLQYIRAMCRELLKASSRGLLMDTQRIQKLQSQVEEAKGSLEKKFNWLIKDWGTGVPWYRSNKKQKEIFYDWLKIKPVRSKKSVTGITLDKEALDKIKVEQPLYSPLIEDLQKYSALCYTQSKVLKPELYDGQYLLNLLNFAGTRSLRFTSKKTPWGTGTNLQNIGEKGIDSGLPNIKEIFIAGPGYKLIEADLAGADARVVAWDAKDKELMDIFRSGENIHKINAKTLFGGNPEPSAVRGSPYMKAKAGVHAVNYGVGATTLSSTLGITVREAEAFIRRWFSAHPAIKIWQREIERQVTQYGFLRNILGFRYTFFERYSKTLLDFAYSWKPSSTVALTTNYGWLKLAQYGYVVLLQRHDSLLIRVREDNYKEAMQYIPKIMEITLPYKEPLVIPINVKGGDRWSELQEG